MAQRGLAAVGLVLALVTVFWAGAAAQSSSCTTALVSMAPCLTYIMGNSSTPSSQCCQQLSTVVASEPRCLCQVLNGGGGSSLGININQTQALALPGACNVQTPPVSSCNAFSPAGSPQSPRTIPGNGSSTSDGSSIKFSYSLLVFLLFATSYGSIFSSH